MMRQTTLLLLALAQLCQAKQPGFSIHEDLLAHPQFEVVFSESYILEKDAQLLLESADQPQPSAVPGIPSVNTDQPSVSVDRTDDAPPSNANADSNFATTDDGSEQISETFEMINIPPLQYLCSVPVLAPPPGAPNQTATDLARAAEARELARASDRGREIIDSLEGECMYYVSGWWSYSFCYGQEIVQFHAVPAKNGKAMKDPHSMEYVLGRMKSRQERETTMDEESAKDIYSGNGDVAQKPISDSHNSQKKLDAHKTELQVKGDQKYIVQRLGGGTICDLTGRDRTLEIQYHCNPGATSDRISWIKEVTTCSYLMEVRTPRLCEEPAFLPPKPKHAHPISCRLVLHSDDELAQWHEQKTLEAREAMASKEQTDSQDESEDKNANLVIGGVVVGGRRIFAETQEAEKADAVPKLQNTKTAKAAAKAFKKSHPGVLGNAKTREALQKATASKNRQGKFLRVIARGLGNDEAGNAGGVEIIDQAELQTLGVNVAAINELVTKMSALAGGKPWHVTAYDMGDETPELRAYIDTDEGEDDGDGASEGAQADAGDDGSKDGHGENPTVKIVIKKGSAGDKPVEEKEEGSVEDGGEGSEETFKKDEL